MAFGILLLLFLFAALGVIVWLWDRILENWFSGIRFNGKRLESFQKPSFPFGNMVEMTADPIAFLEAAKSQAKKTGGFATCWVVHKPSLLVIHPKWARHVLGPRVTLKETDRLVKHTLPVLDLFLGEGIFTARSDTWRKQHRIAMRGMGSRHTRSYFPAIRRSSKRFLSDLETKCTEGKTASEFEAEVRPLFRSFALRTVVKIAFGNGIFTREEEDRVLELFPKILHHLGQPQYLLNAYLYSPLPGPVQLRQWIREAHDLARTILRRYRQKDQVKNAYAAEGSVLKALCAAHDEQGTLSETETVHMLYTFMIGGMDTTSIALSHLAYLLATHPRVQERVTQEVKAAAEHLRTLSSDDDDRDQQMAWEVVHNKLPYLSAVIKETLRLYPSFPYLVERNTLSTVKIGPVEVPKDRALAVCPWITARLPEVWGVDAEVFRPERFLHDDNRNENVVDDAQYSFLTFGAGVRHCIGKHVAVLEMKTMLFDLFQKFRFEAPKGKTALPDRHWYLTVNAMAPKDGTRVRLVRLAAHGDKVAIDQN